MYGILEGLAKRRSSLILLTVGLAAIVSLGGYYAIANQSWFTPNTIGTSHPEVLTMDNYSITNDAGQSNPTIIRASIRNSGTVSVTMSTLSIQDLTGGYSSPTFSLNGQTIPAPDITSAVSIDTLGSGFYFVHGHSYSFTIITSKQTHIIFGPITYP